MKRPILRFLQAARSVGMRVSVAESIDAFHALDSIGYEDRSALKDTLGLVLAKTHDEKQLFDECFELYFKRDDFAAREPEEPDGENAGEAADQLGRMLLANDRAGLAAAMERAAETVGVSEIRFFTQTNVFARRIMDEMGLDGLEREISRLAAEGGAARELSQRLNRERGYLREQVRDFVERQLAIFARGTNQQWRDDFLAKARLSNLDRRDYERMRVIVRAMARRLATRYGRERRRLRRGHLDLRRTLRKNMAYDGVPFVTVWKERKIDKPRVVVLCDVSGSVADVAQFLLLFLYSLNEALSDIHSFAFSSHLVEVSHILEDMTIEDAITRIMKEIGFGSSDYGRSLADFAETFLRLVDNKTSVIIMGDARSNFTNPRAGLMKLLFERARRVIWLNPEGRPTWGTGDSEMLRYRPYCHVARVCNSVRHLEATLEDLLKGVNR
jgi:uncharacterized protein